MTPLYILLQQPLYFPLLLFFFFNDTATTEIYTLSLHDALPISHDVDVNESTPIRLTLKTGGSVTGHITGVTGADLGRDRKSTRLNSSHLGISYAVFCLKKKKKKKADTTTNKTT